MDNVLVDFSSGIARLDEETKKKYGESLDNVPGIFSLMNPMPEAIESFKKLSELFDCYILSASPWKNPSASSDKFKWVQKYLPDAAYKRLILTHHKNLNKGDFLIDDRVNRRGADKFAGELIHFGSEKFPDWHSVVDYLKDKA